MAAQFLYEAEIFLEAAAAANVVVDLCFYSNLN
jgi:hypothetical protein